ncbi:MAG: murein L,D-transpeptidase catalytic domain family protein [Chitinispirillia bacterium]|nr:murein L,D-transpeptidase catalytic domain family protein [Chitinispirillia bacterium]MCL2241951.1 murein L,D-transpeptidase catalytic domain family protein [Chitinispirillia bacterium]
MVHFLKTFLFSLVILIVALTFVVFSPGRAILKEKGKGVSAAEDSSAQIEGRAKDAALEEIRDARIREKAAEALSFCESNGCSTEFCVLIDMKIHSGKHRMFIYDFSKQEVGRMALATHGSGRDEAQSTHDEPLFGNAPGSNLTSLGKYLTGARAYSNWGINVHYKMHGLDTTNSNAFRRIVVLHSYTPIPAYEIYPEHLPLGWSQGCPVTDDETMAYLDLKLRGIDKPALVWIYY